MNDTPSYTFIENLPALLPEITADSIVSRTVYQDKQMRLILFGFAAGEELTEHTAAFPVALHFIAGEATVILGEDEYQVKPGAWLHMPARLPHSVKADTAVTMLLYLFMGG